MFAPDGRDASRQPVSRSYSDCERSRGAPAKSKWTRSMGRPASIHRATVSRTTRWMPVCRLFDTVGSRRRRPGRVERRAAPSSLSRARARLSKRETSSDRTALVPSILMRRATRSTLRSSETSPRPQRGEIQAFARSGAVATGSADSRASSASPSSGSGLTRDVGLRTLAAWESRRAKATSRSRTRIGVRTKQATPSRCPPAGSPDPTQLDTPD